MQKVRLFVISIFIIFCSFNLHGQVDLNNTSYNESINQKILNDVTFKNPSYMDTSCEWKINSFTGWGVGKSNFDISSYYLLESINSSIGIKFNLYGDSRSYELVYSNYYVLNDITLRSGLILGHQKARLPLSRNGYASFLFEDEKYSEGTVFRFGASMEYKDQNIGLTYSNKYYNYDEMLFTHYKGYFHLGDVLSVKPELFAYFNLNEVNVASVINIGINEQFYLGYLNNSLSSHAIQLQYSKRGNWFFGLTSGLESNLSLNILGFSIKYNHSV